MPLRKVMILMEVLVNPRFRYIEKHFNDHSWGKPLGELGKF